MQQDFNKTNNEIISIEEYLQKRQIIRESEQKKETKNNGHTQVKNSTYILAELFI